MTHGGIHAEEEIMLARRVMRRLGEFELNFGRFVTAMVDELRGINHRQGELMAAIDDLKTAVATEDGEIDALVAYVADLGRQLQDALDNDDSEALAAITADVNSHAAELAAAVPPAGSTPTTPAAPADPGALPEGTQTGADGAPLDESHTDANTTLAGLGEAASEPSVPVSDADTPPSQVVSDAFGAGAIGNPETAPGGDSAPPATEDNPVLSGTPGEASTDTSAVDDEPVEPVTEPADGAVNDSDTESAQG